jgi:tRNA G18 (ribose-2'-O)-methylase SpoU
LVRRKYGKSYSHRIRTVSAGAYFLIHWNTVEDPIDFLRRYPGRRIAAVPSPEATPIHKIVFHPSDIVIFGSERTGIPPEIQALCELALTIPLTGRTQSLNLSVAVGIVLAEMTHAS